jgi:hypothetical protein
MVAEVREQKQNPPQRVTSGKREAVKRNEGWKEGDEDS